MNNQTPTMTIEQPRLIQALMAGFNSVASHAWIILIPALMDLLLWFTPRLRVDNLLLPWVQTFIADSQKYGAANQEVATLVGDYLRQLVQNINLSGAVRSYPIGIPSLLAGLADTKTPIGDMPIIQLQSFGTAFAVFAMLLAVGLILGSLYFNRISGITQDTSRNYNPRRIYWKVGQSLLLTLAIFVLLAIAFIPGLLIVSLMSMINQSLGQLAFFVYLFLLFWFAVPWAYAYHGIFVFGLPAVGSVLLSLRVGRMFISRTATLILLSALIYQGLNMLWLTPPVSSWLILVGIGGHAFVSSALISASVVYYRQINKVLALLVEMRQAAGRTA